MVDRNVRIAVVGAGAIGGTTAAYIAGAGWNVELVCKHEDTVERATSPGLHIFGVKGRQATPVRAVKDISQLSGPKDFVLLAVKATDCVTAARELLPYLGETSAVVSLQNGICEEALSGVIGRDRVIGCVVGWGATMHGPGELEITSDGEFVIGNLDGHQDKRLHVVREMLSMVVPTRLSNNIMGELYSKLIVNSCINSLGVLTGWTLGRLLGEARVRKIFIGLMREAIEVANSMGIKVEPGGGGKLDFYRFLEGDGFLADLKRNLLIRVIGMKYRRIRSSSLQSLDRGRRTEVGYLNGYICAKGRENGIATPLNDAVVGLIMEIETGMRSISPANLDASAFQRPLLGC